MMCPGCPQYDLSLLWRHCSLSSAGSRLRTSYMGSDELLTILAVPCVGPDGTWGQLNLARILGKLYLGVYVCSGSFKRNWWSILFMMAIRLSRYPSSSRVINCSLMRGNKPPTKASTGAALFHLLSVANLWNSVALSRTALRPWPRHIKDRATSLPREKLWTWEKAQKNRKIFTNNRASRTLLPMPLLCLWGEKSQRWILPIQKKTGEPEVQNASHIGPKMAYNRCFNSGIWRKTWLSEPWWASRQLLTNHGQKLTLAFGHV